MEKTIRQEPILSPRERLRQLQIKQSSALKPSDWTATDRQELLSLQSLLSQPTQITEAHQTALNRQSMAGIGNNPPLSEEERKLIQEANSYQ